MKKLIVLCCVLAVLSCTDDSAIVSETNVESLPFLSFKNAEDQNSYVRIWASGQIENAKVIAMTPGFESVEEIYQRINLMLGDAETEEEYFQILNNNKDIVYLSADGIVEPVMENRLYRIISNRQGIYQSVGLLHKVVDNDYIVTAAPELLSRLVGADRNSKFDPENYNKVRYTPRKKEDTGRTAIDCGATNDLQDTFLYDPNNCQNDRQTWLRMYAYFNISGTTYTPWFHAYAYSNRKNAFCNWSAYSTSYKTKDAEIQIQYSMNLGVVQVFYTTAEIPNYNEENGDEAVHQIKFESIGPPETVPVIITPGIVFAWAHLAASSRGIGFNNWITLDCD